MVWWNSIFDAKILSRGFPIKMENHGNSRESQGVTSIPWNGNSEEVGVSSKSALLWGKGDMEIFWNYTISFFHCGCWGY